METLAKLQGMYRQAVIDNNQKLQRELAVIIDNLQKTPEKGAKAGAKVKRDSTTKGNYIAFCEANGFPSAPPADLKDEAAKEEIEENIKQFSRFVIGIANFWKFHRNAGKKSASILRYMGSYLLNEPVTFPEDSIYRPEQLNLFERCELKERLGLSPDALGNVFKIKKKKR